MGRKTEAELSKVDLLRAAVMADSLRASAEGLKRVDAARRKRGWTKTVTLAWWEAALTSRATLKRFWQRKPIQKETFLAICAAVGILDGLAIAETAEATTPSLLKISNQDWGEAPDITEFYGRTEELAQLSQWIEQDRCRCVMVCGPAGIGKTYLSAVLADGIQEGFQYLIWRSLRNAPLLSALLSDLLQFLPQDGSVDLQNLSIAQLIRVLKSSRCLLVLDQAEDILQETSSGGSYRQGGQDYGELLRQIAIQKHQSCAIVVSQEPWAQIRQREQEGHDARSLTLKGLPLAAATELLKSKRLTGQETDWETLIKLYQGNPQALRFISSTIEDLFGGNVSTFLQQSGTLIIPKPIQDALDRQFRNLSSFEKAVMTQLSISDFPLSYSELQTQSAIPRYEFPGVLESLVGRSLIERLIEDSATDHEILFSIQLIVRKYIRRTDALQS